MPMIIFVSSWKASSTLLTNGSYEYRESIAENRPPVARHVAGRAALHIILVALRVEYINHTVLLISVYIRAL